MTKPDTDRTWENSSWDEWLAALKEVAVSGFGFDPSVAEDFDESYQDYFDDGYTPHDALAEDLSYG